MVLRRKLPPLNALRAFEVAGRRLNFRLASEELGVTQGAVAQQVRALEDHLGKPLFHRLARGLSLTPLGQSYLTEVTHAFDTLSLATDRLSLRPDKVSISVTPTIAARLLIPRMAALQEALPGVEFRTIADEALPNFDRDDVDIAIGLLSRPYPAALDARLLMAQEVIAVASPSLLASTGVPQTMADLAAMPLVHHCLDHWPAFLGRPGTLPGARYSLTTLAIDTAIAGQGAIVVAKALVARELAEGRLTRLFPEAQRLQPDYCIVRRASAAHSPAALAVWDWCLSTLGA